MRGSVYDSDFDPEQHKGIIIYLNRVPQKWVVAFDTDGGWIDRLKTDAFGKFIVEGDNVIHERLHGEVLVEGF